jgi:heat shock protein HtpX
MFKRIGLFLLTNMLVILTVSLILNIAMPALGLQTDGLIGLAVFCGVFGMTGAFISLAISRWVAKRAYGIQLLDSSVQDHDLREIYEMVARLARQANLPQTPEVGIYESAEPNAFATGPSKKKSLVAFSTGLLSSMNRQEVEAVAAHEITHITNGDMVTMTLLTGIANALVMMLARLVTFAIDNFLRDDDGEGGLGFITRIVVTMALETVFMLLASIPLAYFSRQREYRADSGSARLTSPGSMVGALKSLAEAANMPVAKDSFAIAKISSNRKVSLWSTHPSIEDRIARLQGK